MVGRRLTDILVILQNVQEDRQIVLVKLVELVFIFREFFLGDRQVFQQRTGLIQTVGDRFVGDLGIQSVDFFNVSFSPVEFRLFRLRLRGGWFFFRGRFRFRGGCGPRFFFRLRLLGKFHQ